MSISGAKVPLFGLTLGRVRRFALCFMNMPYGTKTCRKKCTIVSSLAASDPRARFVCARFRCSFAQRVPTLFDREYMYVGNIYMRWML